MYYIKYLNEYFSNDLIATVIYGGTFLTLMPGGFSHYVHLAEQIAPGNGVMIALKSVVLLPFMYHTLNGFRHLVGIFLICT